MNGEVSMIWGLHKQEFFLFGIFLAPCLYLFVAVSIEFYRQMRKEKTK